MNATATYTAPIPTRAELLAGTSQFSVSPSETFIRARELLGDTFHACYDYQITRVMPDNGGTVPMYFLACWTGEGKKGRWVYMGVVHPTQGTIRFTSKSAFPAHATRVRIAQRALLALFAGEGQKIVDAGWTVKGEVKQWARSAVECPF